jgi:hypothetical protein
MLAQSEAELVFLFSATNVTSLDLPFGTTCGTGHDSTYQSKVTTLLLPVTGILASFAADGAVSSEIRIY